MVSASMIVIGDEILGGYVVDVNSPLFADRLRANGVEFTRIQVVPDVAADIDEALQAELGRQGPRLIVTSGGIGSTPDDITYEAVAASLNRPLVLDAELGSRIDGAAERARQRGIEVNEEYVWHITRMARVPEGGRVVTLGEGWTSAVCVDVDGGLDEGGATIAILPGVPELFARLVREVVEPTWLAGRVEPPAVIEIGHRHPESTLNTTFTQVIHRWPEVKVGSYPGQPTLVRLTGPAEAVAQAAALIEEAIKTLDESVA